MYSREYELIYITDPNVSDEDVASINDRSTKIIDERQGNLLKVDDWGVRRLAYDIQKFSKGHFVLFNFLGSAEAVAELERTLRIDDQVLRFLTVKLADRVDVEVRVAEEAAKAAAAPTPTAESSSEDAGAAPAANAAV